MKKLFIYLFAALAVASCEHKDLCYDHSHTIDVEVVFDWRNASEAAPESMSLYLFPTNGGEALRYEFTDCGGGTIRVPVGNYGALCLNSDTENVTYRIRIKRRLSKYLLVRPICCPAFPLWVCGPTVFLVLTVRKPSVWRYPRMSFGAIVRRGSS